MLRTPSSHRVVYSRLDPTKMSSIEGGPDQKRPKVRSHYETRASSNYQTTASRSSRYAGAGNNPSPAPHLGPESQLLIDLTSPTNPRGDFTNVDSRGAENHYNSAVMQDFLRMQETRVDAFLQHSESRAEEQRTALQYVTGKLSDALHNFSNNVSHWLGHPVANHAAQLYHDLGQSLDQYAELKSEYQKLTLENKAMKKQLKETSNKLANITEERDEQLRLAEGANWTGSGKVADDVVKSKWKELDYNIRCMAMALAKCQTRHHMDRVVEEQFSLIAPNWPKLLSDEDYKELILHAYIWMVVFQQIFEDRDGIQGGGHVRNLKAMREQLVGK